VVSIPTKVFQVKVLLLPLTILITVQHTTPIIFCSYHTSFVLIQGGGHLWLLSMVYEHVPVGFPLRSVWDGWGRVHLLNLQNGWGIWTGNYHNFVFDRDFLYWDIINSYNFLFKFLSRVQTGPWWVRRDNTTSGFSKICTFDSCDGYRDPLTIQGLRSVLEVRQGPVSSRFVIVWALRTVSIYIDPWWDLFVNQLGRYLPTLDTSWECESIRVRVGNSRHTRLTINCFLSKTDPLLLVEYWMPQALVPIGLALRRCQLNFVSKRLGA